MKLWWIVIFLDFWDLYILFIQITLFESTFSSNINVLYCIYFLFYRNWIGRFVLCLGHFRIGITFISTTHLVGFPSVWLFNNPNFHFDKYTNEVFLLNDSVLITWKCDKLPWHGLVNHFCVCYLFFYFIILKIFSAFLKRNFTAKM